jgi:hypothetical protein
MTLVMVYTCTFLVFHIVIQQKHYPDLKKKSCHHLEMDAEVQTRKNILQQNENI